MKRRVRFTPTGRTQFLSAVAYIRRDKVSAAQHFREQVERALRKLERFPNSGRVIPEFPGLTQREVVVPPYRFFYRTVGDTVWIVGVWHSAQLPEQSMD